MDGSEESAATLLVELQDSRTFEDQTHLQRFTYVFFPDSGPQKIILRYGYVMSTYARIKSHQQISHGFCPSSEVSTLLLPIAFVAPARRICAFWVISILYTSFCNIYAWLFLANVREVQWVSVQKGWVGFWQ